MRFQGEGAGELSTERSRNRETIHPVFCDVGASTRGRPRGLTSSSAAIEPLEARCLLSAAAIIPAIHAVRSSASFEAATPPRAANASTRPPPVRGSATLYPGVAGIVAGESESVAQILGAFTGVAPEQPISQYSATIKFSGQPVQSIASLSFDYTGALDFSADVPTFAKPGMYLAAVNLYRGAQRLDRFSIAIPVTLNSTTSRVESDSPLGGKGVTINPTAGRQFSTRLGTFTSEVIGADDSVPTEVDIDWGDGTTSAATIKDVGGGEISPGAGSVVYAVTGRHAYARPGRYRIRVSATYSDLGTGLAIDDTAVVSNRVG